MKAYKMHVFMLLCRTADSIVTSVFIQMSLLARYQSESPSPAVAAAAPCAARAPRTH